MTDATPIATNPRATVEIATIVDAEMPVSGNCDVSTSLPPSGAGGAAVIVINAPDVNPELSLRDLKVGPKQAVPST
jgi:hypothetical protein